MSSIQIIHVDEGVAMVGVVRVGETASGPRYPSSKDRLNPCDKVSKN